MCAVYSSRVPSSGSVCIYAHTHTVHLIMYAVKVKDRATVYLKLFKKI